MSQTLQFLFVFILYATHNCFAFRVNTVHQTTFFKNKELIATGPRQINNNRPTQLYALVKNEGTIENRSEPPRIPYLILWLGLVIYAFGFAPGGSPEAAAIDSEIIAKMISTPYDGTSNPLFVAIFNYLGIVPAVYASLLLPGSKSQSVPALPFVVSSFALGFFGVGPYLAARNLQTEVVQSERGQGSVLFESKITALLLLAFGAYLTYYALTNTIGDAAHVVDDFIKLFQTQRLVHVSTVDFTILSLAVVLYSVCPISKYLQYEK